MDLLLNNTFVITFIFFTILWVVYYFFGRKKRKIFIHKDELSWQKKSPEEKESLIYSVFLIGDAGEPSLSHQEPNLKLLQTQLKQVGENSSIFFLGDNIYPKGLPLIENPSFPLAEKKLLEQLKILKDFKGKVFFISGNHDWNKGRKGGFEAMMRQQNYIDQYFKREDVFLPRNGCPGPVEYCPNDFLTFIIINTQWWVQRGKKTSESNGNTADKSEFTQNLKRLLEKNKDKRIIVVGHHPLYSHALHGGKFDMKHHLFPLTALNKKMYIPIPIAGSLYPIYRKYIGAKEDMSHPKYKSLRKTLLNSFHNYNGLIYAAGHDHNLQYIKKHNQHYIVSGAGCKVTYVKKGKGAIFTHAHKGYFRINFYNNGKIWIEAWEPMEDGSIGKLAFRKEITETPN